MSPLAIIQQATADGVTLALSATGNIKATGDHAAVERWLPTIREHKVGIIQAMQEAANDSAERHFAWRVILPNGERLTVTCSPEATAEEMRRDYLGATVEPLPGYGLELRDTAPDEDAGIEALAWQDDDRRRCVHCLNLRPGGVCKVAEPGGLVSAVHGYRPNQAVLHRCPGYRPCPNDPDQRPGRERWPGLNQSTHQNGK